MEQKLKDLLPVAALVLGGLSIAVGMAEGPLGGGAFFIAGAILIASVVIAFAIEKR